MSKQPKIEKGIPIGHPQNGRGAPHIFHKLQIGDSYLTDLFGANSARVVALRAGKRMTSRKQPDGTMRVWRTK